MILAIDIDTKRVLTSISLPVTLFNLQINSLNHELYGAGPKLRDAKTTKLLKEIYEYID